MPARSGSAASRNSRPAVVRRRSTKARIAPDAPRLMIGLALMILGVATGIALLLPGAGKLTDLWRDSIAPWVGSGRRILPFAMLTVGWWMVNRAKGIRADWELTIFGASVSFCASLGLIELIIPRSGGIIGKALAHNLPGLITIPGTGILLATVMTAGFLLAVDISLPAAVAPFARLATQAANALFRPRQERPDDGSAAAPARVDKTEKLGREAVALEPRGKFSEERATSIPPAIPNPGLTSLTFAPPVAAGSTTRDGGPLRDVSSTPETARIGGSIREGSPIRGQHGPGTGLAGVGAGAIEAAKPRPEYHLPPLALLEDVAPRNGDSSMDHRRNAAIIVAKLASFNIPARVAGWNAGPVVTQYEVDPRRRSRSPASRLSPTTWPWPWQPRRFGSRPPSRARAS
jgi:hypothetical protein